jgi:hypothetical protein
MSPTPAPFGGATIKITVASAVDSDEIAISGTTWTIRKNTVANISAYRGQLVTVEVKLKTANSGEVVQVSTDFIGGVSPPIAGVVQSYD